MEHELKIRSKYFKDVISGRKTFEVRENDRKFKVGDILVLKEWDSIKYSGRMVRTRVMYLLDDISVGIQPGYVVLGIELEEYNFSQEPEPAPGPADQVSDAGADWTEHMMKRFGQVV